ncbi:unnamed protein product [Pipistrellus nathusii]|uniref:Uncharacterized protein n=1 Tax=Pipistrellus nathusii TaxID=59473 RepID=A0ABP0AB05_PIPNA
MWDGKDDGRSSSEERRATKNLCLHQSRKKVRKAVLDKCGNETLELIPILVFLDKNVCKLYGKDFSTASNLKFILITYILCNVFFSVVKSKSVENNMEFPQRIKNRSII